ncbi:MAG: hypothetical protein ABIH42_05125, partial [Planctomycetota bacterium]
MKRFVCYLLIICLIFSAALLNVSSAEEDHNSLPVVKRDYYSVHYHLGGNRYRAKIYTIPVNYQ